MWDTVNLFVPQWSCHWKHKEETRGLNQGLENVHKHKDISENHKKPKEHEQWSQEQRGWGKSYEAMNKFTRPTKGSINRVNGVHLGLLLLF